MSSKLLLVILFSLLTFSNAFARECKFYTREYQDFAAEAGIKLVDNLNEADYELVAHIEKIHEADPYKKVFHLTVLYDGLVVKMIVKRGGKTHADNIEAAFNSLRRHAKRMCLVGF